MAQLSLHITQVSWARFVQVQLPAARLSLVLWTVTMLGMRQTGLPPAASLAVGVRAAVGSGLLAAWGTPTLALGHEGVRARDVRPGLLPALRKRFVPGSAS